jgi:CheY-like chemotaxis protein
VSLLGRLEDLSLTDILQIVYLSRRTGILEIVDDAGRHTVLFRNGLVVNASAPDHSDLITYLQRRGSVPPEHAPIIKKMENQGIPCGTAVIELNLMTVADLQKAVEARIREVIDPLLTSRDGEFNFILSDSVTDVDVEYPPDTLFKEGGFAPQRVVGAPGGEKMKPLRGLEESLKAGKALRRGPDAEGESSGPVPSGPAPLASLGGLPGRREDAPPEVIPPKAQFKVEGGLTEIESPEQAYRNAVLVERNPLIRVAAKRAFVKAGVKFYQFGSVEDARSAIADLFRANSYFVTFIELAEGNGPLWLLQQIKQRNADLPVAMVDLTADLRRRHDILRAGADLYLTKPPDERLLPGMAEEELSLYADELVVFAERAYVHWEKMAGPFDEDAGRKFYEAGEQENLQRRLNLLKQLINELSDPNDISLVGQTILRLSGEYLERGALFMAGERDFVGLGGFGITGGGESMDERVRALKITRKEPSILADVLENGEPHRGKMRKTTANVQLIDRLGGLLPTEVVALPIMHSGRPVGILYGDNAEHRAPIDTMTGLEIFLSQAGFAFGNAVLASQRGGGG